MLVPHSDLVEGPQPLVEGPQPMEVAPADNDNAGSVENQATDEPQASRFTWTIENFSRVNMKKMYSDVFVVGGYKWRVLIFPKGNNVDYLSMYLDVADSATLPYGWSRYAQFSLAIVNQMHNKLTVKKDTQHQFNQRESDWGFTSFMPLSELYDPNKGYLMNDTCVVEADVAVRKVIDYWAYDSKKETGYVGLKNQGATCYMNSLLQTLYHIPYFRKAVYHMPTTENDNPTGSIPLALQSLFYKLQYNDTSVATKELTKSFGWDTYDSFMQHDVQELNRVLCEKLEDKMKGTVVEGTIQKLFEGHHMNYIECINVDFKSTRKESFYDLQLDVKGCKDVYASFDKYVEVERLEGDNKYHAEEHGLQDAKKGVLFIDFPPVLQLQLKRFEYDFMRDTMVKINDRYEFPLELDLDRDNGKYLSPDADRSVRNLYMLHSVLVHSGGVHGGHYYAFIRPTLTDQWYKFDDERVTKEDVKRALEEQYGGEEELPQTNPGYNNTPFKFTKYSNAYMLVYIRVSDKDKIICDVDEKDIAEHLRIRLKKEQEEKEDKRRYKAQAHLYTIIKVARDEDLREQIGKDIYFDLVDHDKVRNFRIQKQMSFNLFKEEVAKEFGIPVQFQRFWIWAKRQNHTYRPNRPLTPQEEAQTVGALREVSNKAHNAELKLFLEVERGPDLQLVPPPEKNKEDILLFFKLYDPSKGELRYVGRLFVRSTGKPVDILTKLNELAGFAPDQEIELFEEIKFEPSVMCERLDKRASFRFSQIEDGDIICFQKRPPPESEEPVRFPDVPSFLEYVKNRQIVHFRALERPKEDEFCLELAKNHTYDDVVERVAQHLGLDDPSKIRLTPHNCYSQQPKPNPIKYRSVDHLIDMLVHYNQISDILYYEVLDIPLPELQCLKTLKVAFHHATKDEATILNIRLPKPSTVGDVLNEIKTKVELSHPNAELRLLEVFYHKIYKIFPTHEKIENINDQYWTLRAEEIPEEEKNLGPNDRLIHVYHFTKETAQNQVQVQNFGEPFFLVIHEGETLAEVKARIQKKLQVPDEEFSKWKFAFLSLGRPEYLEDSDIVSTRFQRRDVYGAWEQYLGLEHSDTTPKRSYSASQSHHSLDVAENTRLKELQETQRQLDQNLQVESLKRDAAESRLKEQVQTMLKTQEGMLEKLEHLAELISSLQIQTNGKGPVEGDSILGRPPNNLFEEGSYPRAQFSTGSRQLGDPRPVQAITPLPKIDFPRIDVAARFEDLRESNIVVEFNKLRHTDSYADYVERFEELKKCMSLYDNSHNSETYFVASFMSGLSEELRATVKMFNPTTLEQAIELGQNQLISMEAMAKRLKTGNKPPANIVRIIYLIMTEEEEVELSHLCPTPATEKEIYPAEILEKAPITFNSLNGDEGITTLRFSGTSQWHVLQILIDTGSTLSFIKECTAQLMGCGTAAATPLLIKVANGQRLISFSQDEGFDWEMQGHQLKHTLRLL
ncbi:ubiquitin-specific protease 12 [Perilla frutescens var. frutescens]|nr:ubiquitin-specific protease 12 [Perilla frutescens var. frutescens]